MCWWRSWLTRRWPRWWSRSTKIKLEMVMDVVLDEVDKEVTMVKKLVKEVNEGLVLVYIHCDDRRGYHKVVLE